MIVRELVTLLRYQEDRKGLDSYASGLKQLAVLGARLAAAAAAMFSAKVIMETADAWTTVRARVGLVTNSMAEQEEALASLFEISQRTGQSYVDTANLFTTVGRNAKELNLTLQQQLDLSETVNKAIAIGGGSKAATQAALVQLGQALGAGTLQGQELNSILEQAPRLAKAIADGLGVPVGQLKVLGEGRKLTSKTVAEVLLKQLPVLEAEFAKMPVTFTRAFQVVENRFGKFIDDIGKATDLWQIMARGIITTSDWIFDRIERLRDIVGGYGNMLRAAGIVALSLFGPRMVAMIGRVVAMMWRLLTVTALLRGAAFLLSVGFLAAFEDIYSWWVGKDSITEEIIGPRSKWQATIDAWKDYFLNILNQLSEAINRLGTALGLPGFHEKSLDKRLGDPGSPAEDDRLERMRQYDATHDWLGRPKEPFPTTVTPLEVPTAPPVLRPAVPMEAPSPARDAGPLLQPQILQSPRLPGDIPTSMPPLGMIPVQPVPMDAPAQQPRETLGETVSKLLSSVGDLTGLLRPQMPALGSIVPPAAMAPPNVTNTTNNDVRAPISVTVNSASDTPQAVGAAAGEGARKGMLDGLSRTIGLANPQTEYGLAY